MLRPARWRRGLAAAVLEEGAGDERGEERVASLIQEANRRVFQRSNEDAATSGMGTTMTVALVDSSGGTIAFGHVGDSRAYRVRDGGSSSSPTTTRSSASWFAAASSRRRRPRRTRSAR